MATWLDRLSYASASCYNIRPYSEVQIEGTKYKKVVQLQEESGRLYLNFKPGDDRVYLDETMTPDGTYPCLKIQTLPRHILVTLIRFMVPIGILYLLAWTIQWFATNTEPNWFTVPTLLMISFFLGSALILSAKNAIKKLRFDL